MSANAPPVPSHSPASRIPGVSISSAPPGSMSSSRVTVVWRPRPSCARTAPTAWRSVAEQRVDERRLAGAARAEQDGRGLGLEQRGHRGDGLLVVHAHRERVRDAHAPADRQRGRRGRRDRGRPSSARAPPARRPRARAPRAARRGAPRDRAAARRRARGRRSPRAPARRTLRPRRGARRCRGARARTRSRPAASSATQSPVVGASVPRSRPRAGTSCGGPVEAGHEPARAVLGEHAAGGEGRVAELLELGFEIGSPAEAGGCDLHQGFLHVVVRGTVARDRRAGEGPTPA